MSDWQLGPAIGTVHRAASNAVSDGVKTVVVFGATGWQPIETAPKNVPLLLWSPPWKLSDRADQEPDMRVSTTRDWNWATHWQPLPEPPPLNRSQ